MTCVVCGAQQQSDPNIQSQWRGLEIDEHKFYACPDEFPSDKAEKAVFKTAYQLVVVCCLNEILKVEGKTPESEVESYRLQKLLLRERPQANKGFG